MGECAQAGEGSRTAVRAVRVPWRLGAVVLLAGLVLLFGAARADAMPSVAYKCSPAPQDCSGWYRSNVSIDWIVIPSDATLTGCQDKTFTADTPGTNEFCRADDGAAAVTVELKIKVDKTPPVVTGGTPARAADVDGWYNHAVAIAFAGSDQTSGIAACTATTYGGPDSATASLTGTCRDNAGNVSSPLGYGLKYDETAPAITGATPERAPNAAGWFNLPVRFDIKAGDATSGIADCPSVSYGGPDSASASFTGSCRDRAGNVSNRSFGLKYDATAPLATGAHAARGPDANGWYNHAVSVAFTGSDQTSGVQACTTTNYGGPDGAAVLLSGSCTDRAGNPSGQVGFGLKYDGTEPVEIAGHPARAADANGWYNHPVSIAFDARDDLSGVDKCTTTTYGGPDSPTASVTGTCTDKAGNATSPEGHPLKYDATGPEVTGAQAERPPDHGDWFTKPVRWDITGEDATSGPAVCLPVTYAAPDSATASFSGSCHDSAGNVSSRAFALKFDATPPPVVDLKAATGDRSVALSWETTPDAESVAVVRTPGVPPEPATVVFRGPGTKFADGSVDNGVRYAYEVRVQDAAGNAGSDSVVAIPSAPPISGGEAVAPGQGVATTGATPPATDASGPRLLAPGAGAVFSRGHPPLLRWMPVPQARYYNVQLFRDSRKILSAWPKRPRYRLTNRWSYRGKQRRLVPGEYRWLVWPGFGPRSRADYGRRMGPRGFEITRSRGVTRAAEQL